MKTKKKRLLFVFPNMLSGGAQLALIRVLKYLNHEKYEIGLFLFTNEGEKHYFEMISDKIKIVSIVDCSSKRMKLSLEVLKIFIELVKYSRNYDILIGGLELTPTFLAYFAARLLGKRSVGWVHTAIEPYLMYRNFKLFNLLTRYVYTRLDTVVFVSRGALYSMKTFIEHANMYNAVTIYNIQDYPHSRSNVSIDNLAKFDKIVIAAGRLVTCKGFDVLIKSHAKLREKNIHHSLIILGDGPARDDLQKLCHDLGVEDTVNLMGYVTNPHDYFKIATLFVLSSRFEGLGMVLLEAMMASLPVISTNCHYGPSEILQNGKYGILVPPDDVDSLTDAIEKLLFDTELQDKLKASGPLRAAAFLPDMQIPKWDDLFNSL